VATLLLADDDPVALIGLRSILKKEKSLEIVAQAKDGPEAVQLAEQLKPDVAVVDVVMPGLNGIDAAKQIAARSPKTKVVVLSLRSNHQYAAAALPSGAFTYLSKRAEPSEILTAVQKAARGERHLASRVENGIESYVPGQAKMPDRYESLTAREREVLQLAAAGSTNSKIAERLSISPRTVETHRANLMRKLGLANQSDLVRYAIRKGILTA
jgi:two-component system, NarL family, response regulator NreC